MEKIKIAIIGTNGVPASYGGFETFVEHLIEGKQAIFSVYCSSKNGKKREEEYKGARLIYIPLKANGISSIAYDIFSMIHALWSGQKNFLILGVSGAIFFPILKLFPEIKVITNIDGIEWQRNKWKGLSKIFLKFSEFMAIKFSSLIISDNLAITKYVSEKYKIDAKTIAYGGDHAFFTKEKVPLLTNENLKHGKSKYALSICRIEPENNVEMILEAVSLMDLSLVFIGNWSDSEYGKRLFKKFSSRTNIHLLDPIYSIESLFEYRASCSVYIHGHSAGGTNPSLVEMMFFSKPIIAFDCSFNRFTLENKGNYFSSTQKLSHLLSDIESLTDKIIFREIANRKYTWDFIRKEYLELFEK